MGLVTWLYNAKFRRYVKDQKAIRLAMLALLRDRFYASYKEHLVAGYYPIADREVVQDIYRQYHALGGNGVIDHLKAELDKLPTYPRKGGKGSAPAG